MSSVVSGMPSPSRSSPAKMRMMTSSSFARSSVKSCRTRTAPPSKVMMAMRSCGFICASIYLRRGRKRAHLIGRRHAPSDRSTERAAADPGSARRDPEARAAAPAPDGSVGRQRRRCRRRLRRRRRHRLAGNSTNAIGPAATPSSVTMKSFAVSPSIGLPVAILDRDRLDDQARAGAKGRLRLRRGRRGSKGRRASQRLQNAMSPDADATALALRLCACALQRSAPCASAPLRPLLPLRPRHIRTSASSSSAASASGLPGWPARTAGCRRSCSPRRR